MEKKTSSKRGTVKPRSRTQYKNKKQQQPPPLKVVYISNPMKVVTTASGFRALVQQLTGKDASDVPPPTTTDDDFSESSDGTSTKSSTFSSPTSHVMDSPGVGFPAVAAHPNPDDAFSCDPFFQPSDHDEAGHDPVVFIDRRHMMMFDDHDFTAFFPSSHVHSLINV